MKQIDYADIGKSLGEYYKEIYEGVKQDSASLAEKADGIGKEVLNNFTGWYSILAAIEVALERSENMDIIDKVLEKAFDAYDNAASYELNAADYDWYWNKIHSVFDQMIDKNSNSALRKKAFHYRNPRRGYIDKAKMVKLLEQGMSWGDEKSQVYLGYYYVTGLFLEQDEEKGYHLMDTVQSKEAKDEALLYKSVCAFYKEDYAKTEELLAQIVDMDPDLYYRAREMRGRLAERQGNLEEAAKFYNEAIASEPAYHSMETLAYMHYHQRIANPMDKYGVISLLKEAFRLGTETAGRSLYHLYFESGEEWEDNDQGFYYLQLTALQNDIFAIYELSQIYLYNETYQDPEKGLYWLEYAIELEYAPAYYGKARLLFGGQHLEQDIPEAIRYLEEAANRGYGEAAYRLGYLHESGQADQEGTQDYVKALQWYERAAELHYPDGCDMAGRYYLVGMTGDPDTEKAKAYYEKGVELGSAYSLVELGMMYLEGNGVETDQQKGLELLLQAAEKEYVHAYYLLGRCYKYGEGTEEDPDRAIECFRKAADAGHAKGQAELAYCYETAYGVEEDLKLAYEYMLKSAEQDFPFAQYRIGYYYMHGVGQVPEDYTQAVEWLSKAAEQEHGGALLELGNYYLYDYADLDQQEKAYSYYARAAQQGSVSEGLGYCLFYGMGVEENEPEAFTYFLKGAEDGYVRAMYFTGRCYYWGNGIKQNHGEAFRWFNEAAQYEYPNAMYYKGKMLVAGEGCVQHVEEGVELVKAAAEAGDAYAQYELGNYYLLGRGVEENEDLAMEWFEQAAERGHEQAMKITGRRSR